MSIFESIINYYNENLESLSNEVEALTPVLAESIHLFNQAMLEGHKIIACSSGESFPITQHFCNQLTINPRFERPALPVIHLGYNPAELTTTNLPLYFSRILSSQANEGDILFVISNQGNEDHLISTIQSALECSMKVFCLNMGEQADISRLLESSEHIHINLGHIPQTQHQSTLFLISQSLSNLLEQSLFGELEL